MKTQMLILTLLITTSLLAQEDQNHLDYIETFKDIAIQEMERTGIPASIKLAQGLLESGAGKSNLALRANNHFGIKCGGDAWAGDTFYQEDDDYNEQGLLIPSCFRVYENAEASFRAHSDFLRNPQKAYRYGDLFKLDITDYKNWARGLKDAGYATSTTYDIKLISLIERYELNQYDQMTFEEFIVEERKNEPVKTLEVLQTNDVKYVISQSEESLEDIAKRTAVSLNYLRKYNEGLSRGELTAGTRVFIQPKRNAYRGKETWHVVQLGETMYSISQLYGLKLNKLYERNKMKDGSEPAIGAHIKIRGRDVNKTPDLRGAAQATAVAATDSEEELEMEEPEKPFANALEALAVRQEADAEVPLAEDKVHYREQENKPFEKVLEPLKEETTSVTSIESSNPPVIEAPGIQVTESLLEEEHFAQEEQQEEAQYFHHVEQGDTLWSISQRYGVTVDEVRKLNQLDDNSIRKGMRLRVR